MEGAFQWLIDNPIFELTRDPYRDGPNSTWNSAVGAYAFDRDDHSGNGFPWVSGAKGSAKSPMMNTLHIVTPA